MSAGKTSGGFTGLHMLFSMLAFFGVVIGVNVTMAVFAGRSWTGLVVENSYVASQQFNGKLAESRAQDALGWTGNLAISNGTITYSVTDGQGHVIAASGGTIAFRHPAYDSEDETVALVPAPDGILRAGHVPRDGLWIAEISADVGRDRPFRDARRLTIAGGAQK